MQVDEEIDQRSLQTREIAAVEDEPRARHLASSREVKHPELLADLVVLPRLEAEPRFFAP